MTADAVRPGDLTDWDTEAARARAATESGDWPLAAGRWALVRARFPDRADGFLNGARALRALGLAAEADFLLTRAAALLPKDPQAYFDRVAALDSAERRAEVVAEAEAAFGDDPAPLFAWAEQAQDPAQAAARWGFAAGAVRGPRPVFEAGRALVAAGRMTEADALLDAAAADWPDDPAIIGLWADVAMRRQLWPEAARRWQRLRDAAPDDAKGWTEGARALAASGSAGDADALVAEGLQRFPGSPDLLFRWAAQPADSAEGLRRWQEVRAAHPDHPRAWIEAATALERAWRPDDAVALLEEGMAQLPRSYEVMFYWALFSARCRPQQDALDRWTRLRAAFPGSASAYQFGAHALQDFGQAEAAEALAQEGRARFGDNPEILRALAELALRRGELAVAAERLDGCVALMPGDLGLARSRIDTLLSLQWTDRARAALADALRTWPTEQGFLRQRLMLAAGTGETAEAFAAWQAMCADPGIPRRTVCELGWSMLEQGTDRDSARAVLLFLAREPDPGTRDWQPQLAEIARARGLRPELVEIGRELLGAELAGDPDGATRDVLRCVVLLDVSDSDIRRFIATYAMGGRRAVTARLFCQNYWKPQPSRLADFRRVLEAFVADGLAGDGWVGRMGDAGLLGLLNCAAVLSPPAFRSLVAAGRQWLGDAQPGAMTDAGGAVRGILAGAAADGPEAARADDLGSPFPGRTGRRLRIAVCVSGQLRGYEAAFPTWAGLGLDRHDTTYFVHAWNDVGRNWQRIWNFARRNQSLWDTFVRPNALGFLQPRYPGLIAASMAGSEADPGRLAEVYGTRFVRLEDDRTDRFLGKTNLWKMHYKIEQAHRFAQEDGRAFDLMIRCRPDRSFARIEPVDWEEIAWRSAAARTVFADEGYTFTERHTWLADQFAAGVPEVMDVYASVFSDLNRMIQADAVPLDMERFFLPHANLFYLCFYRGLLGRTMPGIELGPLIDPAMLSAADVLDLVRRDVAGRTADAFDRELIRACEEEIGALA